MVMLSNSIDVAGGRFAMTEPSVDVFIGGVSCQTDLGVYGINITQRGQDGGIYLHESLKVMVGLYRGQPSLD